MVTCVQGKRVKMRLGLMIGYSGSKIELPVAAVQEAERLGYYAVWAAEA